MTAKISAIILVPVGILTILFFWYRSQPAAIITQLANPSAPATEPQFAPSSTDPIIYQPEAQMMTQSKSVAQYHEEDEANASAEKRTTATVAAPEAAFTYRSAVCRSSTTTPYLCFASYYRSVVQHYGVDAAFTDIKKRFTEDATVVALCHPFMHVIGNTAASNYKTVSEAYLHGDSFCWSGYYHGILEGVIARIGIKNLPAQMNTICADIPGKESYNFDYYNCVHGLGHGIMEALGDEVFDSLKTCDNLTGRWEQESCYSGVFMENIIVNTNLGGTNKASAYLKPSAPLYPCDVVADKYKGQCYLGQTSYALEVNRYDFNKTVPLCEPVAQPYRDICNQSIGRDAANQALHAPAKTRDTCYIAPDQNDRNNCIVGAVKEFVSYYHGVAQAHDFCSVLSESEQAACTQTADQYFKVF